MEAGWSTKKQSNRGAEEMPNNEIECDEVIINSLMLEKVSIKKMGNAIHKNNVALLWRSNHKVGRGSGLLISRNLVLTCAHNFYHNGQRVADGLFSVYPGLCGRVGEGYKIEACFIPEIYPKTRTVEFDYALVKLTKMVPADSFLPLSADFQDESHRLAIYGYPEIAYSNAGEE